MWSKGTTNGYAWEVKHFEKGSDYGINGGRISKLEIAKIEGNWRFCVCSYDRGWDLDPQGEEVEKIYKMLLAKFN